MEITRRALLAGGSLAASGLAAVAANNVAAPAPYGVLPSARQMKWSEMEFYNFLHFTVNTFTDREWGYGDESPSVFNPTAFDADAIVETLKSAGSTGVILTCKHHDGFCLWPTKTTEHSIRYSPYKGGHGDLVKEVSEAAARHGLKFGVYLSPWDRNQAAYGTPAYLNIYRRQMRELLTNYGDIFEIWHDGANGGDGYYGGARTKRTIDKHHYYEWPATWRLERSLQPAAVLFSDAGPDVRWVGNEKGIADETCWATYTPVAENGGEAVPGDTRETEAATGTRNGKCWMPAECDVSIRPGWFWHPKENGQVKTAADLLKLFYESAGRGAAFLLNVPPDRRGLIYQTDAASLREFGELKRKIFGRNLAADAKVKASNVRGRSAEFRPENLIDGRRNSYWATDDGQTSPEVIFGFEQPVRFNLARLRENIRLGQRVAAFAVDYWAAGRWSPFGAGTSIGHGRILRSGKPVNATRVRLRITSAPVCVALGEFGLFLDV